jgi:hypothetical protein
MSLLAENTPHEIAFSRNPILFQISTNNAYLIYKVHIETFHKSNQFQEVFSRTMIPDSLGIAQLYIQEILNSYLEYEIPDFEETANVEITKTIKRYYVEVDGYNSSGVNVESITINNSGDYYRVVKGGISHEEYPLAGFWENYHSANKPFLTWWGPSLNHYIGQQHYLNFVAPADDTAVYIRLVFTFANATTETQYVAAGTLSEYDYMRYPSYFDAVKTHLTGSEDDVVSYTFTLMHYSGAVYTAISETITYTLERRRDMKQAILYFNSLSGVDCLPLTGFTEKKFNIDRSTAEQSITDFSNALQGNYVDFDMKEAKQYSSFTGYMSRTEADMYRDLMLSSYVFFVESEQFVRILMRSIVEYDEIDTFVSLKVSFVFNYQNQNYTPKQLRTITPDTFRRLINDSGDLRLINSTDNRKFK